MTKVSIQEEINILAAKWNNLNEGDPDEVNCFTSALNIAEKLLKENKKYREALGKIAQIHGSNGNCGNPRCNCGLPDWDIAKEALEEKT